MTSFKLEHPVFTIEQQELLSAGAELSSIIIDGLIADNKTSGATYPLFTYGSTKEDLLLFLSEPPYDVIFNDRQSKNAVLNNMEKVSLPLPLLEALYYFRRVDLYTYRHFLLVYALSTLIAEQLISDQKDMVRELTAGPTHDIGKLCVPLNILRKKTPLTAEEKRALEHHTLAGYVLLSYYFRDANNFSARVARDHHERRDGSGYPRGIEIDDLMVDIIMVSDIYDALISRRPYRPRSFENRSALEEITEQVESGKISRKVVQALVAVNRSKKPHYTEIRLSGEKRGQPPAENVYGTIVDTEDG